jgi:hypothetical protein
MKSCTEVWKTRNVTFKRKTLIVKIFLLAQMGFETEMRGIELPNMFLSKMSFLDSVEHDPKKLFQSCIAS